jgi:MoxR-like ATPase
MLEQGAEMAAKFGSTGQYIASDDLQLAVNAAVTLQRPLLVKGEPGTGKTELARQVAAALGLELIEWGIKSTTKAQQGLYEYDAVARLRDSHLPVGAGGERVGDARNYIRAGKLWQAFTAPRRVVLLIDEIDKADIEFPNDLLQELDRMEFHVYETGETISALHRPVVIITSNNEKDLPDAFLRRCFFHYIRFPDEAMLTAIVRVHFPDIKESLLAAALTQFFALRDTPGIKKKPSTSEVLDWLKLLLAAEMTAQQLRSGGKNALPALHGALLKTESDIAMFERLAFLSRGEGR